MARPFERIPAELLKPIFSNLSKHDLPSVIRTCKNFVAAGRAVLYNEVKLTLFSSVFVIYPELDKAFFHHKIQKNSDDYLLPTPNSYNPKDFKSYNLLQLWAYISRSPIGKNISNLSIVTIDDGAGYVARPFSTLDKRMVSKALENCAIDKLTKVCIQYAWLADIGRLKQLKILKVDGRAGDLALGPPPKNLRLLHLEGLNLYWTTAAATVPSLSQRLS